MFRSPLLKTLIIRINFYIPYKEKGKLIVTLVCYSALGNERASCLLDGSGKRELLLHSWIVRITPRCIFGATFSGVKTRKTPSEHIRKGFLAKNRAERPRFVNSLRSSLEGVVQMVSIA